MWVKWSNIDDCPDGEFWALVRLGVRFKIIKVFVHIDRYFPVWKDLRNAKSKISLGKWKCIYYENNNNR